MSNETIEIMRDRLARLNIQHYLDTVQAQMQQRPRRRPVRLAVTR